MKPLPFLSGKEVAARLGVSIRTWERLRDRLRLRPTFAAPRMHPRYDFMHVLAQLRDKGHLDPEALAALPEAGAELPGDGCLMLHGRTA